MTCSRMINNFIANPNSGLHFQVEDIMEIDHIIPRSHGGKGEDKNLQLLHRHCHDTKTCTDGF
jgi:RNA-directed DNA polymerase